MVFRKLSFFLFFSVFISNFSYAYRINEAEFCRTFSDSSPKEWIAEAYSLASPKVGEVVGPEHGKFSNNFMHAYAIKVNHKGQTVNYLYVAFLESHFHPQTTETIGVFQEEPDHQDDYGHAIYNGKDEKFDVYKDFYLIDLDGTEKHALVSCEKSFFHMANKNTFTRQGPGNGTYGKNNPVIDAMGAYVDTARSYDYHPETDILYQWMDFAGVDAYAPPHASHRRYEEGKISDQALLVGHKNFYLYDNALDILINQAKEKLNISQTRQN